MAKSFFKFFKWSSIKELTAFSIPIIFGQIGIMLISVGDMFVASAHSTLSVGAIGVATGVFNPVFLFGIGLMMGLSPSLAIARGKGEDVRKHFFSSIVYASLVGITLSIIMIIVNKFVPYMGIDSEMTDLVMSYNNIIIWSFPFAFIFQAIKEFLQSFEDVFFANFISIVAVFVNIGLNYFFIFGYKSFEGYGFDGLAYASFGIRVFLAIALLIYAKKYAGMGKLSFPFMKETLKFSLPIALMFFVEVSAFCLVGILSGGMGVAVSAANTIITNVASITFMVPLSISSAVSVKVGACFGEKNFKGIRDFAFSSLFMTLAFMVVSASFFVLFPTQIMHLVTDDPLVTKIGISILAVVALFQLSDGIQITLSGILRGLSMTTEPFLCILVGYWVLGLPIGIYLAFSQNMQALGLWIGLAISLTLVAIFLGILFRKRLNTINID